MALWGIGLLTALIAVAALFAFSGCITITHRVVFPQLPDRPATQPAGRTDYHGQWQELTR